MALTFVQIVTHGDPPHRYDMPDTCNLMVVFLVGSSTYLYLGL